MKIETITYKRVKNLGNYQSETFEATAIVEPGEEAHIAAKELSPFMLFNAFPRGDKSTVGAKTGYRTYGTDRGKLLSYEGEHT